MKRITTLILTAALLQPIAMLGRQLSPAEALAAARSAKGMPSRGINAANGSAATPVMTLTSGDLNTVYVFNSGDDGGYAVVAADDVASPLLGYSDHGTIDAARMPSDMRWWLDCYSAEIARAASAGTTAPAARRAESRAAVTPIVATHWNQDAPYNDECPELTVNGQTSRAVTGCVATAMAQVMKSHNWPEKGTGSQQYDFTYQGTDYSQSMDFGTTSFDWDEMLPTYDGTTTAAQQSAVAELMHACGVSVKMSYGLAATGGSGASSFDAAEALVNNFGYDKGVQYLPRQYYTYDEWVDAIYGEVSAGRAVMLGGQSAEGGHEFVCDGYSSDDYFHINWGWGGMSDGYFLLSALDPASQGIGGGSNDGFNMNQDAIIGIQPPVEGSEVVPNMVMSGDFVVPQSTFNTSSLPYVAFGVEGETYFYSVATGPFYAALGVKLTDSTGAVSYIAGNTSGTLSPYNGTYDYYVPVEGLAQGEYTVAPAYQTADGAWHNVRVAIGSVNELKMTVGEGVVSFGQPTADVGISVTGCEISSPLYVGSPCDIVATIEATGNFYGKVIPAIVSGQSVIATAEAKGLSFTPHDVQHVEWVATFDSIAPGDYQLVFITQNGVGVSHTYNVTFEPRQTITPTIEVENVAFPNTTGDGTYGDPFEVRDPSSIEAVVTIAGTQGYWADNVIGEVFNLTTGRSINSFGSQFAGVESGDKTEVTLKGSLDGIDQGEYVFLPWGGRNGQLTTNFSYIRIGSTTDVELTESTESPTAYYTMQGIRVDNPISGHVYIVRRGAKVSKELIK